MQQETVQVETRSMDAPFAGESPGENLRRISTGVRSSVGRADGCKRQVPGSIPSYRQIFGCGDLARFRAETHGAYAEDKKIVTI